MAMGVPVNLKPVPLMYTISTQQIAPLRPSAFVRPNSFYAGLLKSSSTMASSTSRHCPSKSNHPRRTTWHTHDLTYNIPSHQIVISIYIDRRLSFPGPSQSGTTFCKKWPQHPPLAPSWSGSAPYYSTRSLTSINEKWVSEGWSCASWGSLPRTARADRYSSWTGLAGYPKVVN